MAIGFDSVSATLPVAFPGMRSSSHFGHVDGMINGEASAEIPFGVCVAQGSTDKSAIKLAATSDKLVGIVMFRHGYADTIELGTTGLKPGVTMEVLDEGECWVIVEEDVTPASAPLVRAVVAGAEIAGAFRDTSDASDLIDVSHFCRFVSTSTLAQDGTTKIAKLRFNFTMRAA